MLHFAKVDADGLDRRDSLAAQRRPSVIRIQLEAEGLIQYGTLGNSLFGNDWRLCRRVISLVEEIREWQQAWWCLSVE
jgi:hypothetical protein